LRSRGQALLELALTLPLLLIVGLGAAQFVRLAISRTGLDAATSAAAAAAARAPNSTAAVSAAGAAFSGVAAGYGIGSPTLSVDLGGFQRGGTVTATGQASLSLGLSQVPALALSWLLTSTATARVEDWRSRGP
jgi:Flp pilus assembly protein TadG